MTLRRLSAFVGIFGLVLIALADPAAAAACSRKERENCPSASAGDGSFDFGAIHVRPGAAGRAADGAKTVARRANEDSGPLIERKHVPTCTGNGPNSLDVLCQAATQTCAVDGEVRFWVYSREVDRRTRATSARRGPSG